MKKRLLSLVLTVAVLALSVSGVLGIFTVNAGGTYDAVPSMVTYDNMFTIFEGAAFAGTFGSTAITGQGHLPGYSPAQKTFAAGSTADYSRFEFDFYLDDISIITARNTKLYLNLRSGSGSGTSRGLFEFQDQLTENGWNHVKILTGLADDKLEILTMARFYIDIDAGDAGAADRYRVANICATVDSYKTVPAMTTVTPRFDIYEGAAFEGTFGSTAITGQGHLPGYSPAQKTFAAGSTADYSRFEFDFYLDDISIITARNTKLYLNLRSGSGSGTSRGLFEFQDQLTENGWNHVKILTGLADDKLEILTMARFYIDIDAGDAGAADRYRVANIFATQDTYNIVPAMSTATPRFDIYEGAAFAATLGSTAITGQGHLPGYNSTTPAQKTFAAGSTADYSIFEFDFYLDDISIISARNMKLYLNLRSGSGSGTSRGIYEFQNQLTANGWNHVKISTDLADDKLEILTIARFYIDIDAGDAGATDRLRIANICATTVVGFASHSLVLTDAVGVNFFMNLGALSAEEKAASYMTFDVDGVTKTAAFDSTFTGNGGTYGFTCYVNSVQMAEAITPTFHYGSKTVVGADYAVKDYIDYVVANSGSFTAETVTLVKAIGDYGHYAQEYFGPKNSWTAGVDYTALAKYRAADYGTDDYTAKASALSAAGKAIDASGVTGGTGNGQFRYNLNFDSRTSLIIQIFYDSAITVNTDYTGTIARDVAPHDYNLYLAYMPISQFGNDISVTGVVDGTDYTIGVSGLSYVYGVLNSGSTSAQLKSVVSALYDYYTAAIAYQATL